jgi:hypothetical protein
VLLLPPAAGPCGHTPPLHRPPPPGHPQLLENKEDQYIEKLAEALQGFGYSVAPRGFVPPAAPGFVAPGRPAAPAADGFSDAAAAAAAAAGDAAGTAAAGGAAAGASTAAAGGLTAELAPLSAGQAAALLSSYDVVFWKPMKEMMVRVGLSAGVRVSECM